MRRGREIEATEEVIPDKFGTRGKGFALERAQPLAARISPQVFAQGVLSRGQPGGPV